jgi:hypothetical protein
MAEIVLTLAAPYVAWPAAETLHVSSVLACVAGGLYLRRHFSSEVAPLSRLQNRSVWDLVIFVLNAAIFLLLGVQFRALLAGVPPDMAVFDAFYATKPGGMGIGLSVGRSIIERHRGRLWTAPNDDPGATSGFSIPVAPEYLSGKT